MSTTVPGSAPLRPAELLAADLVVADLQARDPSTDDAAERRARTARLSSLPHPGIMTMSLLIATCLPLIAAALWWSLHGTGDRQLEQLVGTSAVAVVGAVGGTSVLQRARSGPGELRRPWQLFGASLLAWSAGAAVWASILASGSTRWSPAIGSVGPGDVGYVAALVLYLVAVTMHPALSPRSVRVRALIDAVIAAASLTAVMWFIGGRALLAHSDDVVGTLLALAFPASDVMAVTLCLSLMLRAERVSEEHAETTRTATFMVVAAFSVVTAGDLYAVVTAAHDVVPVVPMATEISWVAAFALIVSGTRIGAGATRPTRSPIPHAALLATLGIAPVLFAILAVAATSIDGLLRGALDPTGLLILTAVVSLVLARQSLTLVDNRALSASLHAAVADLQRQATHDGLTGQPNRSGLTDRIRRALDSSSDGRHRAALLFVDLDHLKSVNDSLGHAAGDVLLRTIANRIAARVGSTVTRFGGDEFVVVLDDLPALDPIASAEVVGHKVVEDASVPIMIEGHNIRPSVSVGIAIAEPGIDPDELLRRADAALYRAKGRGRRCVVAYDPADEADTRTRINLEYELRRAIKLDEFEVFYQPVVELATGRIEGVETLLRWRHPTRGLLMPGSFIDDAAVGGLLGAIGERTLMRVCSDFSRLVDPRGGPPLTVAVNLSTTELVDPRMVDRVRDAARMFDMDTRRIVLEITEDVIVDDTIRATIDELCALGVHLAIDDFGTGNSSLRQLGTYPARTLKIDRSFIEHLGIDDHATAIIRAILGLARNLGLKTVAEGVERPDQARALNELGCDLAQGWLFAQAMPIEELSRMLRTGVDSVPTWEWTPEPTGGEARALDADERRRDQPSSRPSVPDASATMRSSSSATVGRSSIEPTT